MALREVFKFSLNHVVLTAIIVIFFHLFELLSFVDIFQSIISIVIAYLFAAAAIFIYDRYARKISPKIVAFDAGGVYFKGNYLTEEIQPREGFNDLVNELKSAGHVVIMLTNQNKMVSDFITDKFGLNEVFDKVISSGDIKIAKPDPKIFTAVAEALGVSPKNIVFVDDHPANVKGAKAAGLKAFHFKSLEHLREEFKKLKVLY